MWLRARMDLRAAIRFPVSCPAVITAGQLESRGSVLNLSVWGCAARGPVAVGRGDRCALSLLMPEQCGKGPLVIELARVRWSAGGQFGLEFLNMSASARARLRRFLLGLRAPSLC